jgi:GntR family transcriptional regulator
LEKPTELFGAFTLDRTSYVPYYLQVADRVRQLIQSRKVNSGETFWSEGEMARHLGISKMTIRHAFDSLRQEGLLVVEKGKRPRVGPGRIQKDFQELRGFSEEMTRRGMKASSKLLAIQRLKPDEETRSALNLEENGFIYRIQRLRFADGKVVGLETTNLPAHLFPGLDQQDFASQSLYSLLEKRYGVKLERSLEEIEAVGAGKDEAKALRVKPGFPLFSMRRTVYSSEDIPVEFGRSLFRGDRYTASVISRRTR